MILKTLIEHQNQLVKAEVEIEMIPGVPQIHFLGLPDRVIKESFFRIKSALKSAGFKFPVSSQVIVNIRPTSLKKSSSGLELAVALGILHLTGQKQFADDFKKSIIYGELQLDGGVIEPDNLKLYKAKTEGELIVTGLSKKEINYNSFEIIRWEKLNEDLYFETKTKKQNYQRSEIGLNSTYNKEEAELLFLMSVTRKHALLAGQAGAGKSYLAQRLVSFLDQPTSNQEIPVLTPHHSLTPAAFLGGGASMYAGEIEKVDGGILILDELLEFDQKILESLREPMTGQVLRIARAGAVKEIQPSFQVIATTNFCPCGKWIPQNLKMLTCRFSVQKCKGYLNKLSGPLVDRFGLIHFFTTKAGIRNIDADQILKRINQFQVQKSKTKLDESQEFKRLKADIFFEKFYGELSGRRQEALVQIALVYAVEAGHENIQIEDLKKSEKWTIQGFLELEKGIC